MEAAPFDPDNPHVPVVASDDGIRKAIEARSTAANREWLDTLADAPGEYLRRRLAAEYDRRRVSGRAVEAEASPW